MSQREKAGSNAARFAVEAGDEVEVRPGSPASVACRGNWSSLVRVEPSGFTPVVAMPGVSFQSRVEGVAHPATFAASAGSAPPAWFGPPFEPSVARGVFQPAMLAT
jgi:hypothetical protein